MSEIEFWSMIVPTFETVVSVSISCMRLYVVMLLSIFGAMLLLMMVAVAEELHSQEPLVMQPKPAKLSPRQRRRAKRQRLPDGTKRRWKKGLRAPK